jgi:hypothetical protein
MTRLEVESTRPAVARFDEIGNARSAAESHVGSVGSGRSRGK